MISPFFMVKLVKSPGASWDNAAAIGGVAPRFSMPCERGIGPRGGDFAGD